MSALFDYLSWIKIWEDSADNPSKLLTSLSIINVVDYLATALQKLKGDDIIAYSYDIKLLEFLGEIIRTDNIEVKAISHIEGETIERVRVLLSPLCLDKLHIQNVTQCLRKISNTCQSQRFLEILLLNVSNGLTIGEDNRTELKILTDLVVQRLLTRYSPRYVKSLPRRIFTDSIFNPVNDRTKNEFLSRVNLMQGARKITKHLLTLATTEAEQLLSSEEPPKNILTNLLEENRYWRDALYWCVENSKDELLNNLNTIETIRESANCSTIGPFSLPDSVHSIFKYFLAQVSRVVIRHCLNAYSPDYRTLQTTFVDAYFEEASNLVVQCVSESRELEFFRFNPKYELVNASYAAFIKLLPVLLEAKIDEKIIEEEEIELNQFLGKLLELKPEKSLYESTVARTIEARVLTRNFRVSLTSYFETLTIKFLTTILKSIKDIRLPEDQNHHFEQSFISEKLDSYFRQLINTRKKIAGYGFLPLALPKSEIELVFNHILEELTILKRFRVFLSVNHLILNRRLLEINNVFLYDPDYWDLGHHYEFHKSEGATDQPNHNTAESTAIAVEEV